MLATYWFAIQITAVCLLWYASSSAQNIVNKITLQDYPFPLTVALSSLLNGVIYAIPLGKILHITPVRLNSAYIMRTILPISIGKALAITSAYISLSKVAVSYAQTVKATMPIFTVIVSRIMLGEKQPFKIYLSLVPIIFGVLLASMTETAFDSAGLFWALFSTCLYSFMNVLAKKVFDDTKMHPVVLLSLTSQIAGAVVFPIWFLKDASNMWSSVKTSENGEPSSHSPDFYFFFLICFSGILSFLQNLCAFSLIHQLTTLSYAVSNCAKRIAVIILSLVTLKNPVTWLNLVGMMISVLGVFLYNRVKHKERHRSTDEQFFRNRRSSIFELGRLKSSDSDVRLILDSKA
uniref:Sugar phosphate transporter domain-containing protein n=1 Tax=Acrobeloides nanus TaxID=290746 RepID=A0A914CXW0_9BILA